QMATEQAALRFLADIGFAAAPRLIAADLAANVLVLEDLGSCAPLADIIRADGALTATAELTAFARTMGQLGAVTADRVAAYDALRAQAGQVDRSVGRERGLGPLWPLARLRLAQLGLDLTSAEARDVDLVTQVLLEPGPFLVLTN